jgi:hypothetical protein
VNLRDQDRTGRAFEVDEGVRRILVAWGKERDSEIGRLNLRRATERLSPEQRVQLIERLAEISLGLLYVLDR